MSTIKLKKLFLLFLTILCVEAEASTDSICADDIMANGFASSLEPEEGGAVVDEMRCLQITLPQKSAVLPFSENVVVASTSGGTAGSVASVASGAGGSVVQASRTQAVFKLVTCQDNDKYESEAPSFGDSPIGMAIGNDTVRYELGTVAGNCAIMAAATAGLYALSKWKNAEKVRFPGAVILPVLLLSTPTVTSATNLIRFGGGTHKFLGIAYLTIHAMETALVARVLLPSNFKATWEGTKGKWLTTEGNEGYLGKYGTLFREYRDGGSGFMVVELFMNMASGALAAFVSEQSECNTLTGVASTVYGGYALVVIVLHPYAELGDNIYFSFIAVAQATPLIIESTSTESETAQKVASGIPIMLNWILLARSAYEIFMFGRSLYKFYHRIRAPIEGLDDNDMSLLGMGSSLDDQRTTNPLATI